MMSKLPQSPRTLLNRGFAVVAIELMLYILQL